jgi:hypothetical protein
MPDRLPADIADAIAALDGSIQSFDVLSGVALRALARVNELGRRVDRVDKALEHITRIDELMGALARRLRALEAQPEPITMDEVSELRAFRPADTRRTRRGRPKGSLNKRTLEKLGNNAQAQDTAA